MKNTCPFYIVFQVLKILLIKNSKVQPPGLLFLLFLLAFTLGDIIFHKFLELHSVLSKKRIFLTKFPFLTDSLKAHDPLNLEKRFLLMLPYYKTIIDPCSSL